VHIDLDDLSRPEIAELLKEHLTSMFVRAAVLFSIAGAFAACGFFGPQEAGPTGTRQDDLSRP
jgi:hypothetical protein